MAGTDYGRPLLPQHQMLLEESGIRSDVGTARGYASVETLSRLKRLGFAPRQCQVPGLLIPVHNVHGELATYQLRPDAPRVSKGKALKYETPAGSQMALDVPAASRAAVGDPSRPLWLTEGVKKADAAVSHGLVCLALLGVWNWRGTNDDGGKTILADFEHVALNQRVVYLAFDSDVIEKEQVWH